MGAVAGHRSSDHLGICAWVFVNMAGIIFEAYDVGKGAANPVMCSQERRRSSGTLTLFRFQHWIAVITPKVIHPPHTLHTLSTPTRRHRHHSNSSNPVRGSFWSMA